jgi:CheY-like chemotaxis protein
VGELLRRNGYTVLLAGAPDEAIAIASGHRPPIHLLITDVVMPGMNGRALAERVRRLHHETAVVYISG